MNLNGLPVVFERSTLTRFIPLPHQLWHRNGTCDCPHCQGTTSYLDTLVVPNIGPAYMIHEPKLQPLLAESDYGHE